MTIDGHIIYIECACSTFLTVLVLGSKLPETYGLDLELYWICDRRDDRTIGEILDCQDTMLC